MAMQQALNFAVESVVEDMFQHGTTLSDRDLASRKAEEASLRRYKAAGWLRKTVGVVGGKDLPAEPSEQDFRLGLRSGIILCNVLNRVQPGAVHKVIEGPSDSANVPDGAALSVFQYFENVRNYLVAVEEMGLPTFEASDLEQGGKSARVVNSVLALKAYSDWKQSGGIGSFKYGGGPMKPALGKHFLRKNSEPFINSFSRTSSANENTFGLDINEAIASRSINALVRQMLTDKKPEEIPIIVESMLGKVMEEFERRLATQHVPMKAYVVEDRPDKSPEDISVSSEKSPRTEEISEQVIEDCPDKSPEDISVSSEKSPRTEERSKQVIEENHRPMFELFEENLKPVSDLGEELKGRVMKQQTFTDQQHKDLQVLKQTLYMTKSQMQFLQTKYLEDFSNLGKHVNSLTHAASGYRKVLEENRRLYNQIQDLKGNIRVYCRVRPFLPGQLNGQNAVSHLDEGNITIATSTKYGKEGRKSFTFNRVFGPAATQAEVFADTQPLVRSVLDGFNVCIFAYGQTGSGKTYTMTGPKELTEESMGVNFRALNDLFHISRQRKETILYDIHVQMMEIYNEQVRDLLVSDGSIKKLEIRNSSSNGINVPDANLIAVSSSSDVINLMNLGHRNRAVSATAMNDRSSRSHSCLTVHVQGKEMTSGSILRGSMHLVDLAGSERVDKSEVVGDSLKEAVHINKSLSALGDVIASLAAKSAHVPYRNSKLTQLLQDSLGGHAKTMMFVHISPEPDAVGETLSTLKFAERVSSIELGTAKVNKGSLEMKELKEQIANLKAALARKEAEVDSLPSSPDQVSIKSSASTSSLLSKPSSANRLQSLDCYSSAEGQDNVKSKPIRHSYDLQDLLSESSPSWPPFSNLGSTKEDDKESVSGEWVDKVMVKRHDNSGQEEPGSGPWEENGFGGFVPDPSKIYPESSNEKVSRRDSREFDDCDELGSATTDSSEAEVHWQYSGSSKAARNGSGPNQSGPKAKKQQPKPVKSESRSMIPSLVPNPTKKQPNGVGRARPGAAAVDGRRRNMK